MSSTTSRATRSRRGSDSCSVVAGFDISQTLIRLFDRSSTYARAFCVGLLNTLLVAGLGIVLATVLGFLIGIGAPVEQLAGGQGLPAAMSN